MYICVLLYWITSLSLYWKIDEKKIYKIKTNTYVLQSYVKPFDLKKYQSLHFSFLNVMFYRDFTLFLSFNWSNQRHHGNVFLANL